MRTLTLALALVGFCAPAFSDRLVLRAGEIGGEGFVGGLSVGIDYLDSRGGGNAILLSYDLAVDLLGGLLWFAGGPTDVEDFTALVLSRTIGAGSSLFAGAGVARMSGRDAADLTRAMVRLTITSDVNRLVVGQVHLSAADSLGVLAGLSLGLAF